MNDIFLVSCNVYFPDRNPVFIEAILNTPNPELEFEEYVKNLFLEFDGTIHDTYINRIGESNTGVLLTSYVFKR